MTNEQLEAMLKSSMSHSDTDEIFWQKVASAYKVAASSANVYERSFESHPEGLEYPAVIAASRALMGTAIGVVLGRKGQKAKAALTGTALGALWGLGSGAEWMARRKSYQGKTASLAGHDSFWQKVAEEYRVKEAQLLSRFARGGLEKRFTDIIGRMAAKGGDRWAAQELRQIGGIAEKLGISKRRATRLVQSLKPTYAAQPAENLSAARGELSALRTRLRRQREIKAILGSRDRAAQRLAQRQAAEARAQFDAARKVTIEENARATAVAAKKARQKELRQAAAKIRKERAAAAKTPPTVTSTAQKGERFVPTPRDVPAYQPTITPGAPVGATQPAVTGATGGAAAGATQPAVTGVAGGAAAGATQPAVTGAVGGATTGASGGETATQARRQFGDMLRDWWNAGYIPMGLAGFGGMTLGSAAGTMAGGGYGKSASYDEDSRSALAREVAIILASRKR